MQRNNSLVSAILCCAVLVCAALLVPALSHAHRVTVFAWVEGTTVFTESSFSKGNPAVNARIVVSDKAGTVLLEGTTDRDGAFAFTAPKLEDLTIVIDAGPGHRGEWVVRESELREAQGLATEEANRPSPAPAPVSPEGTVSAVTSAIDRDELRAMIDDALDKKLKPLTKMLVEAQSDEPSLTEVIGGIGYIFGIMGIILYFKSRRDR